MTNSKKENAVTALNIEGEMTIYRALELKQILMTALEKSKAIEINLSAVTEIDTSGVQLLVLAKKTAEKMKRELKLVAHSQIVIDVFELLNLAAYFGDPLVIHPSKKDAK